MCIRDSTKPCFGNPTKHFVKVGLADPGGTCETSSIRKNIIRSSSCIIFIVSILASSLLVSEYPFPFELENAFSVTPLPRMVLLLLVLLEEDQGRTDGRKEAFTEALDGGDAFVIVLV